MKNIFFFLLLTTPAMAQQVSQAAQAQADKGMLYQAIQREENATAVAVEYGEQVNALTKERDDLRAKLADLQKQLDAAKSEKTAP